MEAQRAITCAACAKQKTKCDKSIPCKRCRVKGLTCQPRYSSRSVDSTAQSRDRDRDQDRAPRNGREPGAAEEPAYRGQQVVPSIMHTPIFDASFLDMDFVMADEQLEATSKPGVQYDILDVMADAMDDFDGTMIMSEDFNSDFNSDFLVMSQNRLPNFSHPVDAADHLKHSTSFDIAINHIDFTQPSGSVSPPSNAVQVRTPRPTTSSGSLTGSVTAQLNPAALQVFDRCPCSSDTSSSSSSIRKLSESEAILRGQDFWSAFRCNPLPRDSSCPKSAELHLEGLEHALKDQNVWTDWASPEGAGQLDLDANVIFRSFTGITRDVLLALTQEFLQKALKIHRVNAASSTARFIILPPQHVLDYFVRACICRLRPYYTVFSFETLDPAELVRLENEKAGCLLLLMMISQGAIAMPTVEARHLASGLIEVCRISLFDIIEKDINLAANAVVLQCALLFTISGAWSGDKWQMDIAMGQRGMYIAMLENGAFLKNVEGSSPTPSSSPDLDGAWLAWREREHRSRLLYSWVTVDLELSLFYNTMPLLSLKKLNVNMPSSDALWQAKCATDWAKAWEKDRDDIQRQQYSLVKLFRALNERQLESSSIIASPTYLLLLLHPIRALVHHFQQFVSCFSHTKSLPGGSRAVCKPVPQLRLQTLLNQWMTLARRTKDAALESLHLSRISPTSLHSSNAGSQPYSASNANLILSYLIYLDTIVIVLEIERAAASESPIAQMSFNHSLWIYRWMPGDSEQIFFYCGQILRLIKGMPESLRPIWWAAAIYRVALVAWANSQIISNERFKTSNQRAGSMSMDGTTLANSVPLFESSSSSSLSSVIGAGSETSGGAGNDGGTLRSVPRQRGSYSRSTAFVIDALPPDDPVLLRYVKRGEGHPMVTKSDRSLVSLLERPVDILLHGVELLEADSKMRFTVGLGNKLEQLAKRLGA